jgi:polysaccharide export outer membrane protein
MIPKQLIIVACLTGLSACSAVPSFGPERDVIIDAANRTAPPYALVEVTSSVVDSLSRFSPLSFAGRFPDHGPSIGPKIGVGDALQVTVFEAAAGGLFSTDGSRTASVPPQIVANDGAISVPFGGRVHVAGLTTPQAEKAIVARLNGKAIEPQAIVKTVLNLSSSVSVTGDAMNRAARVPLNVGGDRILDVIAQAGGTDAPVNSIYVDLIRGGVTARIAMQKLVADPTENIFSRPGDNIIVWLHPTTFTVMGATNQSSVIQFDAIGLSLQEAIARSGGLKDNQADPEGVFVLRYELRTLAKQFVRLGPNEGPLVPVVYHFNMREPGTLSLAQHFQIRDKDILFVANSPVTDLAKVLNLVNAVSSPLYSGAYTGKAIAGTASTANTPYSSLPGVGSSATPASSSSSQGSGSAPAAK